MSLLFTVFVKCAFVIHLIHTYISSQNTININPPLHTYVKKFTYLFSDVF